MKEYIAMLRNTIIVFMLSCHKDLQCTGGGAPKGVARTGSLQGMTTRGNGQEQEQRDEASQQQPKPDK